MRPSVSAVFLLLFPALLIEIGAQSPERVTCFKCIANDTNCRETCTGMFCYKSELMYQGQEQKYVKRGCLSRKDELSKVDQCTVRPSFLPGGTAVNENLCICKTDRCNGAATLWSSAGAFFAAIFAYFWKD